MKIATPVTLAKGNIHTTPATLAKGNIHTNCGLSCPFVFKLGAHSRL